MSRSVDFLKCGFSSRVLSGFFGVMLLSGFAVSSEAANQIELEGRVSSCLT